MTLYKICHQSGRVLFTTYNEVTARNREQFGWKVIEVNKSREQFEKWVKEETGFDLWRTEYPMTEWDGQQYKCHQTNLAWMAWQASRAAIEVELPELKMLKDYLSDVTMREREDILVGVRLEFLRKVSAEGIKVKS